MKKFLAVLVAIIVVVCIGLTTYYFLRNDEVISFNTAEIYVNVGDRITIQELGKTVKRENSKTTYNYNAGGEEVTSLINFDNERGYYQVNANQGGDVELVIATSNENYAEFKIMVHIGDGSQDYPFYIANGVEFASIGSGIFTLDANYELIANIDLSADYLPVGLNSNQYFSGTLDGNGYTVSGLNLSGTDYTYAGLFGYLNGATISNLKINNAIVNGEYDSAGALAGAVVDSTITKVAVTNADITSTKDDAVVGAFVGMTQESDITISYATGEINATGNSTHAGGFAGTIVGGTIQSTYANTQINVNTESEDLYIGGFASAFSIYNGEGTIRESYANSTSNYDGYAGFIDYIANGSVDVTLDDLSDNKLSYLIGNYAYTTNGVTVNDNVLDAIDGFNLYDEDTANYMIVPVSNWADVDQFIFYSVNANVTRWSELNWNFVRGEAPTLKIDSNNTIISQVSSDYFRKDLTVVPIYTVEAFIDLINEAKANNNTIENAKYTLINFELDLSTLGAWTPIRLVNSEIDFNGATLTNLNTSTGLFSTIENSSVKNLNLTGVTLNGSATNAGALAGEIITTDATRGVSSVENVNVSFATAISGTYENLGGIAGTIDNGAIVRNCVVSNISTDKDANITNVAGLVAIVNGANSSITDSTVAVASEGYLYASNRIAGMVAVNNGVLNNNNGTIKIVYEKNGVSGGIYLAGVVVENNGSITNGSIDVEIIITTSNRELNIAGLTATNNGTINSVKLTGAGIRLENITTYDAYIGGLVVTNNGEIDNTYNLMDTVGTYYEGRNYLVGGVAVYNNGQINNVIAGSNVYGNTVAGAVVEMNNLNARVNGILIAKYVDNTISENMISGDRYVAGVAYNLSAGQITNVQAVSNLEGRTNSTRTSLVVLHFPDGAKLINATINSSLSGVGTFYRETWKDYDTSKPSGEWAARAHYNILASNYQAGEMQSVVINTERAGVNGIGTINAEYIPSISGASYEGDANSSYFKTVNNADFNNYTTYTSNCVMTEPGALGGLWGAITESHSFDMTFDFENTWSNTGSGITLNFLSSINA